MREVIVSEHLWGKIKEVNDYLINELHLSEEATEKRIRRMEPVSYTHLALPTIA